jgi:hypothetical protein
MSRPRGEYGARYTVFDLVLITGGVAIDVWLSSHLPHLQ